jgi:hypothetical protein
MANPFFGRVGDMIASGNNYNRETGQFNATPGQWAAGIGSKLAGLFLGPVAGQVAGRVADGYYGKGPLSNIFNRAPAITAQSYGQIQPVPRDRLQVPNAPMTNWFA